MRNYIDDFLAEAMEQSNASHSFQVGGPHGTPTSQVFFFNLLSGEKIYLMRTLPVAPLEPERDEEQERHDAAHDEDQGKDWDQLVQENRDYEPEERGAYMRPDEEHRAVLEAKVASAQVTYRDALADAYGLKYDGNIRDVTGTMREMYWNRDTDEWFYWDQNSMKWIQTVPFDEKKQSWTGG